MPMNSRLPSLAGIVLILAMLACNSPVEQVPPPGDVQTAAALTLQSILAPSITSTTPSPSASTITASPSVTETSSTATTPSETITPTYSVPVLTVREPTNCRTGPGEEYEIILTYLSGKELEIIGRYDPGNYWLVKSNDSPTGSCWLWGQYVDVRGSTGAVSSVTPPPTATSAPPRAPGIVKWEFSCSGATLTFTVTWADHATNETSYRIFRNGEGLAELPADSTTYTDIYDLPADQNVEYYIQAYSPSGTGNSSIMRMKC